MLLCERELYDNYARLEPLQVFLNLTFDEVCIDYYSLRKYMIWKVPYMYIFCLLPLHVPTEKCYTIITKPIVHIRVATNVVMGALYPKHTRYLSETTQNAR